jgi:DsbC/DsbD-like thiol-disulfide interchange protein
MDTRALGLFLTAIAGLLIASGDARAVSSDWTETEGGRIRLTALSPSDDGVIRAILDVDLLPGWKTYWRDPGDSGVPPSINFEGSTNIRQSRLDFPAPERIDDGYSIWAGYTYPVAFPVTLTQVSPGEMTIVEAQVFLGICKSICIPFQTSFSLAIDPDRQPNSYEVRLVERAHSDIPEPPGNGFEVVEASISDQADALMFSIAHPQADGEVELFLTGPSGWYFDIPEQVETANAIATIRVPIIDAPEGDGLSGRSVRVLVKSADRSMETDLIIP